MLFGALDHLLWTEEVAEALVEIDRVLDANSSSGKSQLWVEGIVSEMAAQKLVESGWQYESKILEKVR